MAAWLVAFLMATTLSFTTPEACAMAATHRQAAAKASAKSAPATPAVAPMAHCAKMAGASLATMQDCPMGMPCCRNAQNAATKASKPAPKSSGECLIQAKSPTDTITGHTVRIVAPDFTSQVEMLPVPPVALLHQPGFTPVSRIRPPRDIVTRPSGLRAPPASLA